MDYVIEKEEHNVISNLFTLISLFFLCLFIFFAHFRYPGTATILLPVAVVFLALGKECIPIKFSFSILIIIVNALGLAYTTDRAAGWIYFLRLTLCLIISEMMLDLCWCKHIFLKWYIFFATVVLAAIYLQMLFPVQVMSFAKNFLSSGAYNATIISYNSNGAYAGISGYNAVAAFSTAILCGIFFFKGVQYFAEKNTARGIIMIGFTLLSLYGIILTNKRSLFIVTIASIALLFLFSKQNSKGKLAMIILLVVLLAIAYPILESNPEFSSFLDRLLGREVYGGSDYTSNRTEIYSVLFNKLKNGKWFFGYGTGSAKNAFGVGGGAHNIYFQILYENGILGLLLWLAFFIRNFVKVYSKKGLMSNYLWNISLFAQLCFLGYGLSGNPLYDEPLFCTYILFCILPFYFKKKDETSEKSRFAYIS